MTRVIEVYGTYREIGYKIGKMFSSKIKKLIRERYHTISREFENNELIFNKEKYEKLSKKLINSLKNHTSNEYEELCGVAEGANVNLEDVIFVLGYSDIFDALFKYTFFSNADGNGCTSFISSGKCNKNGKTYAGQTWDMPPRTVDYIALFHKNIDDGTEFYSYSTILGLTHFGINHKGICIGTTNVSTTETNEGVIFCALIQSALSKQNVQSSLNVLKDLPKVSGHYYYLVAPNQVAFSLEVSAFNCHIRKIKNEIFTHANHYKNEKFLVNSIDYSPSSKYREEFMKRSLERRYGNLDIEDYMDILSSHEGDICRHANKDEKIPSVTCGAVIFEPDAKKIYVKFGYSCKGKWHEFAIANRR